MPPNQEKDAAAWRQLLAELEQFSAEHGHLLVPQRYIAPSGYPLGRRVNSLRERWERLKEERQVALSRLGFEPEGRSALWQSRLALLEEWGVEHGSAPPAGTIVEGVDLAQFYRDARRRELEFTVDAQERLRALPFYDPPHVDRRRSSRVRALHSERQRAFASRQPPRPGPLGIEIRPAWLSGGSMRSTPGYATAAAGVTAGELAAELAATLAPGSDARLLVPGSGRLDTHRKTPPPGRWLGPQDSDRIDELTGPNHLLLLQCCDRWHTTWWSLRAVALSRLPDKFAPAGLPVTEVLELPPR